MNEWRPEGWENPYPEAAHIPANQLFNEHFDKYELAADAILRALRDKGISSDKTLTEIVEFFDHPKKGVLVHIPDKVKK